MDCNANKDERQVERMSLFESLNGELLKSPFTIMRDSGPAVQGLGGLLKVTMKETFSPVDDIAVKGRLPVATMRKQLITLDKNGWINRRGRERTRRGFPRRTCTIAVTKQTKDHLEPYGILPWWACCNIHKVGKLPWSAKAILSVVMTRLCSLKAAIDRDGPEMNPSGNRKHGRR